MVNFIKPHWILLALFIPAAPSPLHPSSPSPPYIASLQYHFSAVPNSKQRRPRRRLGGRGNGNICVLSPGLLEQQNIIWSDRPLFVWNAPPEVTMQQLEVIDETRRLVWEKSLAATDQTARYEGQPLQPGQFYTWRLYWRVQNAQYSADYTFQLMEANQRNPMTADLQSLTRPLPTAQSSPEAIAHQQVNYLLNRSEPLWSDALQVLYSIENPSSQTTQQIQDWINRACSNEERQR
ncbi:hypothetical protein IQ268_30885 [Oculatella sp. LEGE 06141]|uniref:hypothetical protein n=1 Tax=Oculatella sp. LEGE 06141 TaxID=1828648 RepID=UPI001880CEF1|nr:hypothetical protein [Oculatella sp. LEGE 06141]MBE9182944.1 hypothetical protein [Oculatella sp. LEGE 06141]